MPRNLYKEATEFGTKQAAEEMPDAAPVVLLERAQYWTAWYAARRATDAVLIRAKEIGVTEDQWEALRAVAAEVAYD